MELKKMAGNIGRIKKMKENDSGVCKSVKDENNVFVWHRHYIPFPQRRWRGAKET